MRKYQQLTLENRYGISAYLKAGYKRSAIARELGVSPSTVKRELDRNSGLKGYSPKQAHEKSIYRRTNAKKHKTFTAEIQELAEHYIGLDFSPEQTSGLLEKDHNISISHERLYQHIWADKATGGDLYTHLRHSAKKKKKRYGKKDNRGKIPDRISIEQRPDVVDKKQRIGDWEIDTIIGKNHKGALVTIVERVSKFLLMDYVPYKRADLVTATVINLMKPYADKAFTITADNGKEFAAHKTIAKELNLDVYFAHPYHSWERGLNENTNGLIRQYFRKNQPFGDNVKKRVKFVMDRLNNRPRKTLNFYTPNQIFNDT